MFVGVDAKNGLLDMRLVLYTDWGVCRILDLGTSVGDALFLFTDNLEVFHHLEPLARKVLLVWLSLHGLVQFFLSILWRPLQALLVFYLVCCAELLLQVRIKSNLERTICGISSLLLNLVRARTHHLFNLLSKIILLILWGLHLEAHTQTILLFDGIKLVLFLLSLPAFHLLLHLFCFSDASDERGLQLLKVYDLIY